MEGFRGLFDRCEIAYDQFIRTSSQEHYKIVQKLWEDIRAKGDIYLGEYEGWYMVREERFITDNEAEQWGFKDPSNGRPLERVKEASYFFKLSKYQDFILDKLRNDKEWVKPDNYRKEILSRLEGLLPLRDLSISRATFEWGVPVPDHFPGPDGKKHVGISFGASRCPITFQDWAGRIFFWGGLGGSQTSLAASSTSTRVGGVTSCASLLSTTNIAPRPLQRACRLVAGGTRLAARDAPFLLLRGYGTLSILAPVK